MAARRIAVEFTPTQLRVVNAALALAECDWDGCASNGDGPEYARDVRNAERARQALWDAPGARRVLEAAQ